LGVVVNIIVCEVIGHPILPPTPHHFTQLKLRIAQSHRKCTEANLGCWDSNRIGSARRTDLSRC